MHMHSTQDEDTRTLELWKVQEVRWKLNEGFHVHQNNSLSSFFPGMSEM